jgi:HD-GYP domain-containing protein (c-di-GMP phosphodiesterase class II)
MSSQAAGDGSPGGLQRYLPLSLVVTFAVTLLPLVAVAQLGPARSAMAVALHVLAAVALSIAVAWVLAALWSRHERSADLVFGDLLLWGWARRALAERRLDRTSRRLVAPGSSADDRVVLLRRMSELLETRDPYTHGHSRRVARHAERTARQMGLPRELVEEIRAAALVHDIGKINIPRPVLTKPGKLTDTEFALVKRHPGDGAAMVAELGDAQLTGIVRHHHERMDGTGYPDRLAGDDIPIGARVIAVADTFDAITSTRPYRKPRTHRQALDILEREAGTQLDPLAVAAFVSYYASRKSVGWATMLAAAPQRLISGLGGVQSGLASGVAPIAQTACSVGGVALIGACLGGPVLPQSSTRADAAAADHGSERQLASQTNAGGNRAGAPGRDQRRSERTPERDRRPAAAEVDDSGPGLGPGENVAPRALEVPGDAPSGGGGGGQSSATPGGGISGGAGSESVVDVVEDLPDAPSVLQNVQTVLDPVTDQLLPVQLPIPAPVQVPQVEVPQVQVPRVGLPKG